MSDLTITEQLLEKALRELQEVSGMEYFERRQGDIHAEHEDIETEFAAISEVAGISFDSRFKRSLCRFDEISACWKLDSPAQLCGEFGIVSLRRALAQQAHENPLEEGLTPAERQRWSEFRPFDGHSIGGTGEWVALRIRPNTPNPELWYYHPETENYAGFQLDIDYPEYLQTLAITKGTYGWQKLFCDIASLDEDDMSDARESMEEMLEIFPSLFPGYDYGPLRIRLAERS